MKKLNTNNTGRMPLWQADLEWIQQAYTGPIEAIVRELGYEHKYFIFEGCHVRYYNDPGEISMSAGWFWWNGELLPVRALERTSTYGFDSPVVHLSRVAYADPAGSRDFIKADQSAELVEDVWQDDYIMPSVVEINATQTEGVNIDSESWTLSDILDKRIGGCESDWISCGLTYPETLSYKRIGRTVIFNGGVRLRNDTTPAATGLPMSLNAVNTFIVPCKRRSLNGSMVPMDGELCIYVNSNGNLIVQQTDHDPNESDCFVNLTGMTYIAEQPYVNYVDPKTVVFEE